MDLLVLSCAIYYLFLDILQLALAVEGVSSNRHKRLANGYSMSEMIQESIAVSVADLEQKHLLDRRFYTSGVDGHSYYDSIWHHGRFMKQKEKEKVQQLNNKACLVLRAVGELIKLSNLPPIEILTNPKIITEWRRQIAPFCKFRTPKCNPKLPYRKADGTCNNLRHPRWGSSFRAQLRFLPPAYHDGFDKPRMFSVSGRPLPSPRLVSNVIHNKGKIRLTSKRLSVMFMNYGQFIDHDIIGTPVTKGFNNSDIMCCTVSEAMRDRRGACFPIMIPKGDPRFRKKCMNFVRSLATPHDYCDPGFREQLNQHTSFLDASMVYGTTRKEQKRLRTGVLGLLRLTKIGLLPEDPDDDCIVERTGHYCFLAGDDRNSIVPSLGATHILFVREHNRIARILHYLNPHWGDERLFQEARKIVAAQVQHITYSSYLPLVLDKRTRAMNDLNCVKKGYNTVYDPSVDATTSNVFGVSAFRFGHSQVPDFQKIFSKYHKPEVVLPIQNTFNRPRMNFMQNGCGADGVNRWMVSEGQSTDDRFLDDGVRNYLFLDERGESLDLAALNIQRGRDHGVPGYNKWRKWCGLKPAIHFRRGPGGLIDHDAKTAALLSSVYYHPDDIDVFTGGLSEMIIPGGLVGPTFSCILARQFRNYKLGDRFWYENNFPGIGFTPNQLKQLRKSSISKMICNNLKVKKIQPEAFLLPSHKNPVLPCDLLPDIDLRHWKERKPLYGPSATMKSFRRVKSPTIPYNPVPLWMLPSYKKYVSISSIV